MFNSTKFRSYADYFRSERPAHQLYWLSCGIFLLTIPLTFKEPFPNLVFQALTIVSLCGFSIGFSLVSWSVITKIWDHPFGKILITIPHLFVLILSAAFARKLVAISLELPPQDFDLTVSFFALILYIPVWTFVASILLCGASLIWLFVYFYSLVAKRPLKLTVVSIGHMVGSLGLLIAISKGSSFIETQQALLRPAVKWVAFAFDYYSAPLYPRLGPEERVRLHENGVVSTARVQGKQILISVRKYDQ